MLSFQEFKHLAKKRTLFLSSIEVQADLETPVSAYLKVAGGRVGLSSGIG